MGHTESRRQEGGVHAGAAALSAVYRDLESHWGLPAGVLDGGPITWVVCQASRAAWTPDGGAVMCHDAPLAAGVALEIATPSSAGPSQVMERMAGIVRERQPGAACSLDVGLFCSGVSPPAPGPYDGRVEQLTPDEVWPEGDHLPTIEHVFAIRDGAAVVARAHNVPQLRVGDRWVSAVGVTTHPDWQGRGLGKAVVSALLRHLADEGGLALWNADANNTPSLPLARSLGFREHLRVFSWGA